MLLLFPKGIHNVEGIAVDWMGNNLYWTDDGPKKTISVARLEKAAQTRKTLIEGKMTHPRAIVVDPLNGCVGRQGSRGAHGHGGEDPPGSAALHTRGVSLSPRALVVAPKLCQRGRAGQELLEQRWQQLLQPRGSSGHGTRNFPAHPPLLAAPFLFPHLPSLLLPSLSQLGLLWCAGSSSSIAVGGRPLSCCVGLGSVWL